MEKRSLVRKIFYSTACQSSNLEFRMEVAKMIDILSEPHHTRIERGWSRNDFWMLGGHYFAIFASEVGNLSRDIQRMKHFEELKVVRLFSFWGTRTRIMITVGGRTMTQDRWVYEEVTKIISPDHIAIMPTQSNTSRRKMGLPNGPNKYRILEPSSQPPHFIEIDAAQYEAD